MDQNVELSIWLGTAGLALTSGYIMLWRTRRGLRQARRHALVQEVRTIQPAVLAGTARAETARPGMAS